MTDSTSKLDIWRHFRAISRSLQAESTVLQGARDNLARGVGREDLVTKVLANHLPSRVVFGKGEIVDCERHISTPIDVILYRDDVPKFNLGENTTQFLVEGVYATVEVKSYLSVAELDKAIVQVAAVKQARRMHATHAMRIWYEKHQPEMLQHLGRTPSTAAATIFGFSGVALDSIVTRLRKGSGPLQPDSICILGSGCLRRTNGDAEPWSYDVVGESDDALMAFIFFLIECVASWRQLYTWDWYVRQAAYLDRTQRAMHESRPARYQG